MTNFDHDVFISFSHIDNDPLIEGEKGWITMFHTALYKRLAMILGATPDIWRDKKLAGNDNLNKEVIDQLLKAATLVAVLSPRYLRSDWCKRELKTFLETAEEEVGLEVGNKSRIFKVIKTPIKPGDEPPVARRLLGYEFYTRYPDSGRWREFNRAFGKEMEMEFWQVLDDLAQDLAQLIELINADGEPPPGEIGTKVTIYLAEATFDLDKDCAQLRRDLTARGYQVLPDQALPLRGDDLETVVNGYLERAELSIHPIGSYSGPIPECHDRPLEQIQNSLATARSQADQLTRLVWIPQGQEVDEKSDHGKFIAELEDDPNLNTRDELLKSTIEELKTVIQDKLNPKPPTVQDTAPTTTEFQRVYLIFDGCDRDGVVPLDDYLYEQGFEIITPSFDGEPAELERDHAEKLRLADGVIIYCAEADKAWLDACKLDLAKAPKPQRTSAIYLDAPKTRDKERFRTREVDVVIRAFDGFDATLLKPFVAQLIGAGQ